MLYNSYARPVHVIRDIFGLGIGIPRTIHDYNVLKSTSEDINAISFKTSPLVKKRFIEYFCVFESRFEYGRRPPKDVVHYTNTFSEAASQAGYYRIYGGIHFDDVNVNGLELGSEIGLKVCSKAMSLSHF